MKYASYLLWSILTLSQTVMAQTIDSAHSQLKVVFTQMGVPVDSHFSRFTGEIQLNTEDMTKSTAKLDIDMASFDLGEAEYNQEVAKADWFDVARHPKAQFVSSSVRVLAADKLELQGNLSIKGHSSSIQFPVQWSRTGSGFQFSGQLPIKRLMFQIGQGEWQQTDLVADEVVVKFNLQTLP